MAAAVFGVLTAVVIVFQLALAGGAPWGSLTWGGRFPGRLPAKMRGAALLSAAILAALAAIVSARAGLAPAAWQPAARSLIWIVVAYCAVGVVMNAITPSRRERHLWLPVVSAMLICSIIVARS